MLGSEYDNSPYTQAGERVSCLAMGDIRLVIDEFRTDVTTTRKSVFGVQTNTARKFIGQTTPRAG